MCLSFVKNNLGSQLKDGNKHIAKTLIVVKIIAVCMFIVDSCLVFVLIITGVLFTFRF